MICDSIRWLGVIVATEIRHPVLIPRRLGIWRGIPIRRLLADPENRAGDVSFPWVEDATGRSNRASCWLCLSGSGGDDNLGCGGFRHGLLSPNARNRSEKKGSHNGPEDWKFSEKSKHHLKIGRKNDGANRYEKCQKSSSAQVKDRVGKRSNCALAVKWISHQRRWIPPPRECPYKRITLPQGASLTSTSLP